MKYIKSRNSTENSPGTFTFDHGTGEAMSYAWPISKVVFTYGGGKEGKATTSKALVFNYYNPAGVTTAKHIHEADRMLDWGRSTEYGEIIYVDTPVNLGDCDFIDKATEYYRLLDQDKGKELIKFWGRKGSENKNQTRLAEFVTAVYKHMMLRQVQIEGTWNIDFTDLKTKAGKIKESMVADIEAGKYKKAPAPRKPRVKATKELEVKATRMTGRIIAA